ncbi:GON-4-like protein isoform X2 [Lycorma delicatula]|uniref:GON-4-like protein isoform X2 n=1 Tax=Lycorma delicatula TaxID=130591 RepID=UPI003F511299
MSVNRENNFSSEAPYYDFYTQWLPFSDNNEQDSCNLSTSSLSSSPSSSSSVTGLFEQEHKHKNQFSSKMKTDSKDIMFNSLCKENQEQHDSLEDGELASMSEDIDRQLDHKAEKSKLTVFNVKNILKSVIMNEDVVEMVCNSLKGKHSDLPYEPKLTRSRTRELRDKKQPLSTVCALPLTDLTRKPFQSECHVLIEKELPEDSSDEEYKPSDDILSQSEDDFEDTKCNTTPSTSKSFKRRRIMKKKKRRLHNDKLHVNEEVKSNIGANKSSGIAASTTKSDITNDTDKNNIVGYNDQSVDENGFKETIGHRTRSKLSLSETPLETIEQQFIPPDITCDMYDWNCDNEDWKNFLKEFTQPLDALPHLNETIDDVDADPEYNVLADEDEIAEEDKEELRVDRAVKVSRKELNGLMKELFEYNEMISDIEKEKKDRERAKRRSKKLQAQRMEETKKEESKKKTELLSLVTLDMNQTLLLKQQLRQHVQLLTQHYLQTYGHPVLHYLSLELKRHLIELHSLGSENPKSYFCVDNLNSSITIIEKWEKMIDADNERSIITFLEKEIEKSDKSLEQQVLRVCKFPPLLMQLVCESDAFPYPLLLPPLPFYSYNLPEEFVPSEEQLLVLGFSQFLPYVKEKRKIFKISSTMNYAAELISKLLMPVHSPMKILKHTKSQRNKKLLNPLQTCALRVGNLPWSHL